MCYSQGINRAAASGLWRTTSDVGARNAFFLSYTAITEISDALQDLSSPSPAPPRGGSTPLNHAAKKRGRPRSIITTPRPKRSARDVKDLAKLRKALKKCGSPFSIAEDDGPKRLIHLVSGVEAVEDVAESLLSWRDYGAKAAADFVKLVCGKDRKLPFTQTMKRTGLKSFESKPVRGTSKAQKDVVYLSAAASCFLRLIILNDTMGVEEQISVEQLSQYELAPLPFSLCNPSGVRHTTQKCKLLHKVLTDKSIVDDLPPQPDSPGALLRRDAIVVDLMKNAHASVAHKGNMVTFGDLVSKVVGSVFRLASLRNCNVVYIVGDVYEDGPGIKSSCQEQRAGKRGHKTYGRLEMRTPLPSARELSQGFLRVAKNKTLLLNLLRDNFHTAAARCKERAGTDVFMMIGKEGWRWGSSDEDGKVDACPELNCSEFNEADQRMLVAVRHFTEKVSPDGGNVVLASEDTDVCVAATSFYKRLVKPGIQGLYILRGGSKPNLYDVGHAVSALDENGEGFHEVLLSLHVLTGCDSTSSFYKRSKVGAFNKLVQLYRSRDEDEVTTAMKSALQVAGTPDGLHGIDTNRNRAVLKQRFVAGAEQFVCGMYGCDVPTLNEARKDLWTAGKANPAELPPTEHCFRLHLLRVYHQMEVWQRSMLFSSDPGCYEPMEHQPQQFGWDIEFRPIWMERDAAPLTLLQHVHCKSCKTGCGNTRCTCVKNQLKCTKLCGCRNCDNRQPDTCSSGLEQDVLEEMAATTTVEGVEEVEDGENDDTEREEAGPACGADTEHCEVQTTTMGSGSTDEGEQCDVEEGMDCEEDF